MLRMSSMDHQTPIDSPDFHTTHLTTLGLESTPTSIAYSPSQSLLAVGLSSGTCRIIGQRFEITLEKPTGVDPGSCVNLVFKGRFLVARINRQIIIWSLVAPQDSKFVMMETNVVSIRSIPDSDWLAVLLDSDALIYMHLDTSISEHVICVDHHGKNVSGSPVGKQDLQRLVWANVNPLDSNVVLLTFSTGLSLVWDTIKNETVHKYYNKIPEACCMGLWNPTGESFVVVYQSGKLLFWNIKKSGLLGLNKSTSSKTPAVESSVVNGSEKRGDVVVMGAQWVVDGTCTYLVVSLNSAEPFICIMQFVQSGGNNAAKTMLLNTAGLVRDFILVAETTTAPAYLLVLDETAHITCWILDMDDQIVSTVVNGSPLFDAKPAQHIKMTHGSAGFIEKISQNSLVDAAFPLAGGYIGNQNGRKMYDLLVIARARGLEFWQAGIPACNYLYEFPIHPLLEIEDVTESSIDVELKSLVICGKFGLVLYTFESNVYNENQDDIDDLMAKLDDTMGKVMNDSKEIRKLANKEAMKAPVDIDLMDQLDGVMGIDDSGDNNDQLDGAAENIAQDSQSDIDASKRAENTAQNESFYKAPSPAIKTSVNEPHKTPAFADTAEYDPWKSARNSSAISESKSHSPPHVQLDLPPVIPARNSVIAPPPLDRQSSVTKCHVEIHQLIEFSAASLPWSPALYIKHPAEIISAVYSPGLKMLF